MIRDALAFVAGLAEKSSAGELLQIGERHYWKSGGEIRHIDQPPQPVPPTLTVHTLTGLVDYIRSDFDELNTAGEHAIQVVSPTEVLYLEAVIHKTGQRRLRVKSQAFPPQSSNFGTYMKQDLALIWLQTGFAPSAERSRLLSLVGRTKKEGIRQQDDDGITQTVTVKGGVHLVGEEKVVNPFLLAPWRTFHEIEQPVSPFVLRLREGAEVEVALFEADGGAWKLPAIQSIAAFLREQLPDTTVILA